MAINDNADPNLHVIKAYLYEHHFENAEGKYIARTSNERTLSLEDIAEDMKSIDNFPGTKQSILDTLNSFIRMKLFRLADGYGVTDGLTITYPQITGTFDDPREPIGTDKHKVIVKQVNTGRMRKFAATLRASVEGIAAPKGQIYNLRDVEEHDAPHNAYLPGNMVVISGDKIKVSGDHPECGVYFVPEDDPSARVKMERIAENKAGRIFGIAPNAHNRFCRIEIVTQYSGGSNPLKERRTITGGFTIEAL